MEGSIVDTRDGRRRPFRWQPGTVVFGSGVEADLVLPDPAVSPKHGRFEVTEQGCRVVVEEGLKPVKVNGISTHESDVEVGDVVKIGPFQLSLAGAASVASEAAAAPEEEPAPPPPPPPARRPMAPSRHAAAAARPAASVRAGAPRGAAPTGDPPVLDEARAASRYRARTAGSKADARSWLIGGAILAGIALIAVGFIAFSGNPWAGLADETMITERAAVNAYVKNCDFEGALARVRELMTRTSDSSVQNKLIDLRDQIEKHKAEYNEGKRELDRIRNTVGKRMTYYIVNDDLPVYINNYGQYAPLAKEAEQLREELRQGKMSVPAGTSEADLAPGQAAPAFEKRNEHGQGKDGTPDAPIKKDGGKDGNK